MSSPRPAAKTFDRSLVEGPIGPAVWKIAWPTMLQNVIAGLQGIIDHAMVGHFVGYTANAAIGVSWQIVIVVIVFASSVFSGMGVLVARFAGANQPDKVNRVVYQAFLTAAGMSIALGAAGWFAAPSLLRLVNAAPAVAAEALPFLRAMFVGILGMMIFFMLERRLPRRGRRADAAAPRPDHDGAHDRLQRDPDPAARHDRRGATERSRAARSCRRGASGGCASPSRSSTSSRA